MAELDLHAGLGAPPIVVGHTCADPDACGQLWLRLKGVAARRGEIRQPADLEAARHVMSDVAREECLLDHLAAECLRWSPRA